MRSVLLVISIWQTFFLTALSQAKYPPLPDEDYSIQSLLINRFTSYNRSITPSERSLVFIQPVTEDYCLDKYRLIALKEQIVKQGKLTSFAPDSSWVNFIMTLDVDRFKKCTVEKKFKLPSKNTTIFTQELSDRYFGKNGSGFGYYGLRKDYKNFAAIVSFSNVIFSTDGNKSFCYFSKTTDGEAGAGYLVFLEKTPDGWAVAGSEMIWIS